VLLSAATLAEFPEDMRFPLFYMALLLFLQGEMSVKIIREVGRMGI
jgi:hypothetical protein